MNFEVCGQDFKCNMFLWWLLIKDPNCGKKGRSKGVVSCNSDYVVKTLLQDLWKRLEYYGKQGLSQCKCCGPETEAEQVVPLRRSMKRCKGRIISVYPARVILESLRWLHWHLKVIKRNLQRQLQLTMRQLLHECEIACIVKCNFCPFPCPCGKMRTQTCSAECAPVRQDVHVNVTQLKEQVTALMPSRNNLVLVSPKFQPIDALKKLSFSQNRNVIFIW